MTINDNKKMLREPWRLKCKLNGLVGGIGGCLNGMYNNVNSLKPIYPSAAERLVRQAEELHRYSGELLAQAHRLRDAVCFSRQSAEDQKLAIHNAIDQIIEKVPNAKRFTMVVDGNGSVTVSYE